MVLYGSRAWTHTDVCCFPEERRKGEEACWNTLCPHSGQKIQLNLPREISGAVSCPLAQGLLTQSINFWVARTFGMQITQHHYSISSKLRLHWLEDALFLLCTTKKERKEATLCL